jgi:hypothetical protein
MKRFLITLGMLLLVAFGAAAQEVNAARLALEDTTYINVELCLLGETGVLKDVFSPDQRVMGTLEASSQRTVGKVGLYGRFGYGYDYGRGSTWRGWIDPYETPFMLADSIPGPLSIEMYSMEAGAGFPLGGGWSAGLDMAYDVGLMAKHKDLRNKNTSMRFRITPGIYWQGEKVGLGLDLGYERNTERVEYSQESTSEEHMLFDIYGLWVGRSMGFSSAENRRMKENDRFLGDFQLDLSLGNVSINNNLNLFWMRGVQTEVGYNNQQFGTTRSWTWIDDLEIQIGESHAIEAEFLFSTLQGFRPLQRQELDPASRIRVWVTYGDPVFCYWRRMHFEHLQYTYGTTWKLRFGLANESMSHAYTEYPHRFSQTTNSLLSSAGADIPLGRQFVLSPWLAFEKAYGMVNDYSEEYQILAPLLEQWDFWDGDNWHGALGLGWTAPSGRIYVQGRYAIMSNDVFSAFRHEAVLKVGFNF